MSIATVDVAMETTKRLHSFFFASEHINHSKTFKPAMTTMTCPSKRNIFGPTPVPEQADFPPAPQKKKVKRYFKWKDNYLVQCNLLLNVQNG